MIYRFFQRPFDYFFPLVLFVLLSAYAFFDVSSNAQAGNVDMSRGRVYVLIVSILVFLLLCMVFYGFNNLLKLPIIPSLLCLLLWIIIDNVVNATMGRAAQINIMLCVMWIGVYYCFFQTTKSTHDIHIYNAFYIILFFLYCIINVYAQRNIAAVQGRDYGMTSYSYYLLSFLPALLLVEKKTYRVALMAVCSVFVLLSLKRGPILALPFMLLVFWLSKAKLGENRAGVFHILLFVALLYGAVALVNHITNGFLFGRFSNQELASASGRDQMWSIVWEQIKNRDFFLFLFGTGSGTSIQLLGTGVHNEWLEFLYTFGAVGVFFYVVFFASLIRRYFKLLQQESRYSPQYGAAVAFFFLSGLSDGFFFVYWTFYFFSIIGHIEALALWERQ